MGAHTKVAFHTLGCKVNQYETEAIKEAFVSRGALSVDEDEKADIYVINTCTVTGIADRKSRQFIRRAKKMNPDAIVVATGCYAQVAADEIGRMPEVDLIIGNDLKSEIAERALKMMEGSAAERESHVLSYEELSSYEDMGIVTADESSMCRAYIKIEDGCDRFCSYCLIPFARGRVRSRKPGSIIEEAKELIKRGYRELVLTGINTALYGSEPEFDFERLPGEEGMSGLEVIIKRLDMTEGDFRIRLSSLEPTVVSTSHVESLLKYEKLCHHLHLSVQSGSDRILAKMNRKYSRDEYIGIVNAIREFDPLFGITTDIIVGFPGESEEDFEDSEDMIKQAAYARVHVFRYSPRKGTFAAGLKDRVSGDIAASRASRLEKSADEVSGQFIRDNFGKEHTVLVEEEKDGYIVGYTGNYIKVYIPASGEDEKAEASPRLGEFCKVQLKEIYKDGCIAEII